MFRVTISPVKAVEGVGRGSPGNIIINIDIVIIFVVIIVLKIFLFYHDHHHLNHITVATGRWLVVLQGRTTEEPRLPKISPANDRCDDVDDYKNDDGVCGNDDDLNKVESVVGSWMESQYATESNLVAASQSPQANMPIWPGRYRPNVPIRGHIGEIFQSELIYDTMPILADICQIC